MAKTPRLVALIDMDSTLCDYYGSKLSYMQEIYGPLVGKIDEYGPKHEHTRFAYDMISNLPGWWRNLRRLGSADQLLATLSNAGFDLHVLTKCSFNKPIAWSEKVEWFNNHVRSKYPNALLSICSDKSLVYGRILVDDWPEYFLPWLDSHPRGIVLCPRWKWNENIEHPRLKHYEPDTYCDLGIKSLVTKVSQRKVKEIVYA